MTKASELREKSDVELKALQLSMREEIFQFRNAIAIKSKEVKPHFIRERRKDIARILMILAQRNRQPQSQG